MLHPQLGVNDPSGIHYVLSLETPLKFLNETNSSSTTLFSQLLLHSTNQIRKHNSNNMLVGPFYEPCMCEKKLNPYILHTRSRFNNPNHV
jgi:hypothetical protein